jgi:hypothetical protein
VLAVDHVFAMFNKGKFTIDDHTLGSMLRMLEETSQYQRMLRFMDYAIEEHKMTIRCYTFELMVKSLCSRTAVCLVAMVTVSCRGIPLSFCRDMLACKSESSS